MAITVKHTKVSTIPDGDDSSLIRPSDWNDDHQLTGTVPVANGGTGAATLTGYVKGNGTSVMTASATVPSTDITGLGTMSTQNSNNISVTGGSMSGVTISDYVATATKGIANGVASLDGSGTVPISQLPSAVLGALSYQGTWNASTNTPTLTSSVGTKGYYYVVNVAGTTNLNGITDWQVGDWAVYNGTAWQKIDNTDAVTSVNGKTGTVVLNYNDVGAFPATSTTGSGNVVLATGATQAHPTISDYEQFTPSTAPSFQEARLWYDSSQHLYAFYNDVSSAIVHVGQDTQFRVINNTGSTIANGTPVYITSASSGITPPNIALAKADVAATSAVIGLTNGSIANGAQGYVTAQGVIDGVNTGSFTVGQVLYLSPYSAGQLMNTIPPTGIAVQVGVVSYVDSSAGKIFVKQTTPLAVPASIITGTLGVANGGTGATTLTGYVKGSGTSAMTASSTIPTTDLSGTITNAQLANSAITINGTSTSLGGSISVGTVTSVTGTSPVVSSGGNTPAISMPAATSSVNGYLTSADWTTFNSKQPAGTYVTSVAATSPVTSSGGTTPTIAMPAATTSVSGYLTSTDWNTFNGKQPAGTYVNSVSGTSGRITSTGGTTPVIDLASGVATAGTTGSSTLIPVVTIDTYGRVTGITTASNPQGTVTSVTGTAPVVSSGGATPAISMAAANTTTNGYLTSTDWNTFNGKGNGTVTSVTATSPVTSTGGATPVIAMPAATTSVSGYLTSTDWNTFNGKAPAVTYTTNYIPYGQGTTTPNQSSGLQYNGTYLLVGTTAVIGGLTNPISAATGSANNYIQKYVYNANTGISASADVVAYPNNGSDTSGWVDMGITSSTYADTVYTVTGPNEAYLFGSAPSGAGKTGNLVYATDSTGTANAHQWYIGGFTQAKSAYKMQLGSTGLDLKTTVLLNSSAGTSGQVLTSAGAGATPTWSSPTGSNITAQGLYENSATISANYTIGTGNNAMSAGPITVSTGVTVTVPTGSTWTIV